MAVKPNMTSVQFMHIWDVQEMVSVIRQLKPRIVKFNFLGAGTVRQVLEQCPEVEGIVRLWWDFTREGDWSYIGKANNFEHLRYLIGSRGYGRGLTDVEHNMDTLGDKFDPVDAVLEWAERAPGVSNEIQQMIQFPDSVKRRLLIEGHNETGGQGETDFLRFEKQRALYLQSKGLRAVVYNSGVGWTLNFQKAKDVGLLQVIQDGNHYLGTHAYGNVLINMLHDGMQPYNTQGQLQQNFKFYRDFRRVAPRDMFNSWLAFRAVRYDYELKTLGYPNIKQVLTEWGLDRSAPQVVSNYSNDANVGAWKGTIGFWRDVVGLTELPDKIYADELWYGEQQLRVYEDFLVGALLYTYGADSNSAWTSFDVRHTQVIPLLADTLSKNPFTDTAPQPNPAAGCTVTLAEKQPNGQPLTALNVRSKPYIITAPDGKPANRIATMTREHTWKAIGKALVDGVEWLRVQTTEGQFGWVSLAFTKVTCIDTTLPVIQAPPRDDVPTEDCSQEVADLQRQLDEALASVVDLQAEKETYRLQAILFQEQLETIQDVACGSTNIPG